MKHFDIKSVYLKVFIKWNLKYIKFKMKIAKIKEKSFKCIPDHDWHETKICVRNADLVFIVNTLDWEMTALGPFDKHS